MLLTDAVEALDYPIIYVRQPRHGDELQIAWPEVFNPAAVEPGSELILRHPDGREEVLVDTEDGAVTDPMMSFDGKWVYYSYFPDAVETISLRGHRVPVSGADIYKLNLSTRERVRLTRQEFTPNTGAGKWSGPPVSNDGTKNSLGYGVLNLGPAPAAGGRIMFTSSRNGFRPNKNFTSVNLQLFIMDSDGKNVEAIGPMSLGSALHPTPLSNGRFLFSSYESQGLRDRRLWGIWSINPDGTQWEPELSAFGHASAFHFMTELPNRSVVVADYYNKNNFGFGALYKIPPASSAGPRFHTSLQEENPEIHHTVNGDPRTFRMAFSPKGIHSITPSTSGNDLAAADDQGKYTHPSAAPGGDLLVSWSPGPVNRLERPRSLPAVDSGIYIIPDGDSVADSRNMEKVVDSPHYNEAWPRAVVPYSSIHGIDHPPLAGKLSQTMPHLRLPEGSPYGLIGTSSFYNKETEPGGVERDTIGRFEGFNSSGNESTNWRLQGASAGRYSTDDIWAVRVLSIEPSSDKRLGPLSHSKNSEVFFNHANERLRILGEIPLRKFDSEDQPILDYTGAPDTSFVAKIPADTPFTFQTLDRNGAVLNMAQTWHQLRPGEVRVDCGGCHAHGQSAVDFSKTAAARQDYDIVDLSKVTPLMIGEPGNTVAFVEKEVTAIDVEFYQDVRPLLQTHCVSCHQEETGTAPAMLDLSNVSVDQSSMLPNDYQRLCADEVAQWGIPPISRNQVWLGANASRYVRKFQSRRSLLAWKIMGRRMDGWSNDDFPTEVNPGDPDTLAADAKVKLADIDFHGELMPPSNSGAPPLDEHGKRTLLRWIDLGCPIDTAKDTSREGYGWYLDETRPALTISEPKASADHEAFSKIVVGFSDAYSGVNRESFAVSADFPIDSYDPGEDFSTCFVEGEAGVFTCLLGSEVSGIEGGTITVSIADNAGNISVLERTITAPKSIEIDVNHGDKLPRELKSFLLRIGL